MNAQRGMKNVIANIANQVLILLLGIITPRLVLVNLGSEANGLMNTVNQALTYLALLEAGVGAASLQALYGPVAKDDKFAISSIMAATQRFYRRTGAVYFAAVVLLSLVFPYTIQSTLPKGDIMLVMFLSGMPGVINYYFYGKYKLLLQAEGKDYIFSVVGTVIHAFTSISKIILLLLGFGIVGLQAMYLIFSVAQTVFIMIYVKRHYKWLDKKAVPNYGAISQSKNALVHQVSTLIFNNTDGLILTYLCGLSTVSVYSMYSMFYGIIGTLISSLGGLNFIFGQTFNTDRKRYTELHDIYEQYMTTLAFSLFCIVDIFILPFMKLYTAGVSDIQYIDKYLPYLFAAVNTITCARWASSQTISYAGHFKQTQWRSILESVINLTVSILCAFKFGIYGVLIGTVAALFYRANDMIIYANKKILKRGLWVSYRRMLVNIGLFAAVTLGANYVFSFIALDSYLKIILWAVVCCIVIVPLFFGVMSLCDRRTYRLAKELVMPYLKGLFKKSARKT